MLFAAHKKITDATNYQCYLLKNLSEQAWITWLDCIPEKARSSSLSESLLDDWTLAAAAADKPVAGPDDVDFSCDNNVRIMSSLSGTVDDVCCCKPLPLEPLSA